MAAQTTYLILPVKFLTFQEREKHNQFVPKLEVGEVKLKVNENEKTKQNPEIFKEYNDYALIIK